MTSAESRLAHAIIGRIDRYRQGKTDLRALIMELHLFIETYDSGQAGWATKFQDVWGQLMSVVEPWLGDPAHATAPDAGHIERHLETLEALLRELG